jgi:hypothetical protein
MDTESTDAALKEAARRGKRAASSAMRSSYTDDEREFLAAMDRYKRQFNRPHPTWCEVLAVLKSLGWSKTT